MDRLLGEPARADEIRDKDIVWNDGGWRKVLEITLEPEGTYLIHLEGRYFEGVHLHLTEDDLVMRGWRFIVARRLEYDSSLEA